MAGEAVIWHDVECGGYDADLPHWRELAAAAAGPILELGCGTGRVALDLAGRGHEVSGVDKDPELIAALRARTAARDLRAAAHVGDARALELGDRFALIAIPMQMLQLLDGRDARRAVLETVRAHLAPAGRAAISIVEGVPAGGGELAPLPDVAEIDGWVYSSLPLAIADEGDRMAVTRLRQIVSPAGELTEAVDQTHLAVLTAAALEGEARAAGLKSVGRREVPTTPTHVGSTVVILERT